MSKVCRVCGVELTDENWRKSYRENHDYICVNCRKVYSREYMRRYCQTHRDKVRESHRRYRETHRDKIRETQRQYYMKNREKIIQRANEWKKRHRELIMSLSDEEFLDVVFPDRHNEDMKEDERID